MAAHESTRCRVQEGFQSAQRHRINVGRTPILITNLWHKPSLISEATKCSDAVAAVDKDLEYIAKKWPRNSSNLCAHVLNESSLVSCCSTESTGNYVT